MPQSPHDDSPPKFKIIPLRVLMSVLADQIVQADRGPVVLEALEKALILRAWPDPAEAKQAHELFGYISKVLHHTELRPRSGREWSDPATASLDLKDLESLENPPKDVLQDFENLEDLDAPNHYSRVLESSEVQAILEEYRTFAKYPFLRSVMVDQVRYLAIGLMKGVPVDGPNRGFYISTFGSFEFVEYQSFSAGPKPWIFRDAGPSNRIKTWETSYNGLTKYLILLAHVPGRVFRLWFRRDGGDVLSAKRKFEMVDTETGWVDYTVQ